MKKAAISTYCTWQSYGSILQSYALKQFLLKMHCESFVVWDEGKPKDSTVDKQLLSLRSRLVHLLKASRIKYWPVCFKKNNDFIEKNIDIKYYNTYNELKADPPKADVYLAGSDQIFHPDLCKPLFFLDYVPKNQRKISYAASMGVLSIKDEKKNTFQKLIENFSILSVREIDVAKILKDCFNKKAEVHIDPTFLLRAEEWRKKAESYPIKDKYILVYALYWNKKYNEALKRLHKKTGINIVEISTTMNTIYANRHIYDAGVSEFLWLIDHAEAVVTSSFHGAALSTIFNKKLSIVVNPNEPSRINSLMSFIGLKPLEVEHAIDGQMDYIPVNARINEERERSFQYLDGLINKELH